MFEEQNVTEFSELSVRDLSGWLEAQDADGRTEYDIKQSANVDRFKYLTSPEQAKLAVEG